MEEEDETVSLTHKLPLVVESSRLNSINSSASVSPSSLGNIEVLFVHVCVCGGGGRGGRWRVGQMEGGKRRHAYTMAMMLSCKFHE